MKRKVVMRIILVALGVILVGAGGAIASSFRWIGPYQGNFDWGKCQNWVEAGCEEATSCICAWPSSRDDDALILYPPSFGPPEVNLDADYTIDDLILKGPIIFTDTDAVNPTLTVDVFQIQGPAVIEIKQNATIVSG